MCRAQQLAEEEEIKECDCLCVAIVQRADDELVGGRAVSFHDKLASEMGTRSCTIGLYLLGVSLRRSTHNNP